MNSARYWANDLSTFTGHTPFIEVIMKSKAGQEIVIGSTVKIDNPDSYFNKWKGEVVGFMTGDKGEKDAALVKFPSDKPERAREQIPFYTYEIQVIK